jgi:drug/metabolite transporter (DMT)-like permease
MLLLRRSIVRWILVSPFALSLLAIVLIGNTAGQLLFKAASLRASRPGSAGHWEALAFDPLLWLALLIYLFEFFMWLAFLSMVPLWQGVMVACVDILLVMLGGRLCFGEQITGARMLAISLIAVGVLLVGGGGA